MDYLDMAGAGTCHVILEFYMIIDFDLFVDNPKLIPAAQALTGDTIEHMDYGLVIQYRIDYGVLIDLERRLRCLNLILQDPATIINSPEYEKLIPLVSVIQSLLIQLRIAETTVETKSVC